MANDNPIQLIADVQRKHRRILNLDDGFSYCQGTRSGQCDFQGGDLNDFEAHVAAEIDKALGGLAAEWGVVVAYPPRPDDGYPGAVVTLDSYRLREAAEDVKRTKYPEDDYEIRSRWVSGWSEVQR